jgi:hypothetical protein
VPASYKILLGFAALVVVAIPLRVWFGLSSALGYLFGLVMMTSYLIYLLLFVEQ